MKLFFEFFPLVIFFIVYKSYDIFLATIVTIIVTAIIFIFNYLRHKKVEKMQLVTLVLLFIFGGATVILQDETFIKWKPTVINWAFALAFYGSHFIGTKTLVERMMSRAIDLPKDIWLKLSYSWILFFLVSGIANIYVAFNFSTDIWVNFKLFGMLGLTVLFLIFQAVFITKYVKRPSENN